MVSMQGMSSRTVDRVTVTFGSVYGMLKYAINVFNVFHCIGLMISMIPKNVVNRKKLAVKFNVNFMMLCNVLLNMMFSFLFLVGFVFLRVVFLFDF